METESIMKVARDWREGGKGNYFCKLKSILEMDVSGGYTAM